jgi:hypothetical protein
MTLYRTAENNTYETYETVESKVTAKLQCKEKLHQRLPNGEMHMIPFTECQSDGETRIDTDRCAAADVKVATAKVACDGSGFFFREVAGTFVWAKCGGGSASESAVVVVVLLCGKIRHVPRVQRGGKGSYCGSCGCGQNVDGGKRRKRTRSVVWVRRGIGIGV